MSKHKVQAYDVSEKTKAAIERQCKEEQRSESFIISRLLNKIFDPINIQVAEDLYKCCVCGKSVKAEGRSLKVGSIYYCELHGPGL